VRGASVAAKIESHLRDASLDPNFSTQVAQMRESSSSLAERTASSSDKPRGSLHVFITITPLNVWTFIQYSVTDSDQDNDKILIPGYTGIRKTTDLLG
jgi:hypothetical protein